jgi:hypothetical protein
MSLLNGKSFSESEMRRPQRNSAHELMDKVESALEAERKLQPDTTTSVSLAV